MPDDSGAGLPDGVADGPVGGVLVTSVGVGTGGMVNGGSEDPVGVTLGGSAAALGGGAAELDGTAIDGAAADGAAAGWDA
jgi:hypothetical protein